MIAIKAHYDGKYLVPDEPHQIPANRPLKVNVELAEPAAADAKRSILALEGLGAEIWQGVDPQAYVDGLRSEWDQRGK